MTVIAALLIASLVQEPVTLERIEVKIPGHLPTIKMIKIPEGKITVNGRERTVKPVWIAETELTWDVFEIYAFRLDQSQEEQAKGVDAESRPSRPYGAPDRGFGNKGFAALGMTGHSAKMFCEWLSKKTGKKFRLPTEVEWEFAARAGATQLPSPLGDYAWFWDNADDQARAVGSKKPNPWGFHDMLGNVWEWTVATDARLVVAGGGFSSKAPDVNFTTRRPYDPKWQEADAHNPKSRWWLSDGPFIGMRVACDP